MDSTFSSCVIIVLAAIAPVVYSVPDEFCLDLFDDGDCGKSPTSVFYYYKPGSRCEVRTWRGCPTLNKFLDFFSCSHFCVGRIWGDPVDEFAVNNSSEAFAEKVQKEKVVKVMEIFEEQFALKEEIKELEVKEIQVLDEILDDVVKDLKHPRHKLSFDTDLEPGPEEEKPQEEEPEEETPEETTTFAYGTPVDSDFEFEEQEVEVPRIGKEV